MTNSECIKVIIRVRPLNQKEKQRGNHSVCQISENKKEISLIQPDHKELLKTFSYDQIFTENDEQSYIYEHSAFSLVEQVVLGYNGTIFAYGQTGCGKTHTMVGLQHEENKGLIPRTFTQIMNHIAGSKDKQFLIRCSFIEIYQEDIKDLLSDDVKAKKDLKECPEKGYFLKLGLFIKDLNQMVCKTIDDLILYMNQGTKNRTTASTLMNNDSSRSHSIFTIYVECQDTKNGKDSITAGKLNLVDLAGSERQSKTGATGDRLKEANKINLSLSALGNVISALVDGKSNHIPYRDSKLTRLLQDSLGGNTKTIMIAAISPANYNYDETLGTLRYAARAKNIINKPKINQDPKDALLKEYQSELEKLKKMLQDKQSTQSKSYPKSNLQFNNDDTNENFYNELKMKEQKIDNERKEKEKIEKILKDMENQMVKGKNDEKSKKKLDGIKQRLEEEKNDRDEIELDKQYLDDQLQDLKDDCENVQDQAKKLRNMISKLKKKLKSNVQEIKDIQREDENQREDLLETIRQNDCDKKFLEATFTVVFSQDEIQKFRKVVTWNQNKQCFIVPKFEFIIKLPKLINKTENQDDIQFNKQDENFKKKEKFNQNEKKTITLDDAKSTQNFQQMKDRFQIYNSNFTLNINNNVQNNLQVNYKSLNQSQNIKRRHRLSPLKNVTQNIATLMDHVEKPLESTKSAQFNSQQRMQMNIQVNFNQNFQHRI